MRYFACALLLTYVAATHRDAKPIDQSNYTITAKNSTETPTEQEEQLEWTDHMVNWYNQRTQGRPSYDNDDEDWSSESESSDSDMWNSDDDDMMDGNQEWQRAYENKRRECRSAKPRSQKEDPNSSEWENTTMPRVCAYPNCWTKNWPIYVCYPEIETCITPEEASSTWEQMQAKKGGEQVKSQEAVDFANFMGNYTSYYNFINATNISWSDNSYMGVNRKLEIIQPGEDDNLPYYFNELEYQRINATKPEDKIYLCANGACDILLPKLCDNGICSPQTVAGSIYFDLSGYSSSTELYNDGNYTNYQKNFTEYLEFIVDPDYTRYLMNLEKNQSMGNGTNGTNGTSGNYVNPWADFVNQELPYYFVPLESQRTGLEQNFIWNAIRKLRQWDDKQPMYRDWNDPNYKFVVSEGGDDDCKNFKSDHEMMNLKQKMNDMMGNAKDWSLNDLELFQTRLNMLKQMKMQAEQKEKKQMIKRNKRKALKQSDFVAEIMSNNMGFKESQNFNSTYESMTEKVRYQVNN